MLRKRTRSHQKNQHINNLIPNAMSESYFQSDILSQKHKSNSFLKGSGLFVVFNPKNSECDSVRSPTSPLDLRIISGFGNPFRCPRAPQSEAYQKRWNHTKVGLSIIDSLDDETKHLGEVTSSLDNKNILFGRQMSIRSPNLGSHVNSDETPKSLPENLPVFTNAWSKPVNVQKGSSNVVFEIGEAPVEHKLDENFRACSLDSGRYGRYSDNFGNHKFRLGSDHLGRHNVNNPEFGSVGGSLKLGNSTGRKLLTSVLPSRHSGTCFIGSVPSSEIELSEDYTCVRTHGPNPKVTHIFGDCILECHNDEVLNKSEEDNTTADSGGPADVLASYPPNDFLKFCYSCQKKLDGEDIYMYRGEKAFCSYSCRSHEIEIDEELEKTKDNASEISDKSNSSMFIAT